MFRVIKKTIRPNIDIKFFTESHPTSDAYKEHVYNKFVHTGKLIKVHQEISDDKLTATQVMDWFCREDFLDFLTDNICAEEVIEPGQLYNIDNNIATEIHSEDI